MHNNADEFSRRQFMAHTAKTVLGVSVAPMLGTTVATNALGRNAPSRPNAARSCIFLNMSGGMSHLDTFDPKLKNKDVMGPARAASTNVSGMYVSTYLPKMAEQMDKVAVINSMVTTQGAHEQGRYFLKRSYRPRGTIVHPALGAWVMRLSGRTNSAIPGYVAIGSDGDGTSGFLGPKFAAVPIRDANSGLQDSKLPGSVAKTEFERRLTLAEKLNKNFHTKFNQDQVRGQANLYDEAIRLMKSEDLKAFDIAAEPGDVRKGYGESRFGQGCLLARRLVEHGVRFIEVSLGGWDTHYDNFTSVEARAAILDEALAGLLVDLHRRGLLDSTLVAVGTEFGRTPDIVTEHKNGRDHYPRAYSHVLAGGGIKGGQAWGETDSKGAKVKKDPVSPPDFNATIAHAMGLPVDEIIKSPSGRPFTVADKGRIVEGLF